MMKTTTYAAISAERRGGNMIANTINLQAAPGSFLREVPAAPYAFA